MKKLVLAASAIAALAIASPAAAQNYPPVPCTVTTSGSLLTPGESFTVSGSCAGAGASVTITMPGLPPMTLTANSQGQFAGTFLVPKNIKAGIYTLTAREGSKVLGTTRMNVLAPLSSSTGSKGPSPLAVAGGSAAGLVLLGGLALWLKARGA